MSLAVSLKQVFPQVFTREFFVVFSTLSAFNSFLYEHITLSKIQNAFIINDSFFYLEKK